MSGQFYEADNLTHILNKIHLIIKEYEGGAFLKPEKLIEAQRMLSANIYYLTVFQVEFNKRWNAEVHNVSETKSNAAAKVEADEKYPELLTAKRIIEAASRVCVSMSQELKIISNE
jgi:hypothetical protein